MPKDCRIHFRPSLRGYRAGFLLLSASRSRHAFVSVFDTGHLCDEAVDIFSLAPGVGTDINGFNILPVEQVTHNGELLFTSGIISYLKFSGKKAGSRDSTF